jgi:RHS repeat-associated protein
VIGSVFSVTVNGAVYDYAGRLQTLTSLSSNVETRTYNTVGQIASIGWSAAPGYPYTSGPTGTLSYTFSATQNNGQITQATDGLTGETTVYQYDALKRLTSASNSSWNETFSYDGFSNLTGKTLNGTLQSIPVNPATNQLSGVGYDYNGNMTLGAGATMTYNEDNRMSSAQEPSGGIDYYYYTPDGKRFCRQMADGDTQYTLYGVRGEALGTYSVNNTHTEMSVYFGGRRLWQAQYFQWIDGVAPGGVFADRLGSNRNVTSTPAGGNHYLANYYPYGDVPTGTIGQDQSGFATYTQDSYTTLDYANQRMYASTYGRFNTPDPAKNTSGSAGSPSSPGSWNMYAYAKGDPVNRADPGGTDDCDPTTQFDCLTGYYCPPEYQYCSDGSDDSEGVADCGSIPADEWTTAVAVACAAAAAALQSVPAPQPTCSIELYSRPAFVNHNPGKHTYILVDDPDLIALGYTSNELMLEGRPSNNLPFGGSLVGNYNPPGQGLASGKSIASDPSLPTNHEIGSAYDGANACSDITGMLTEIQSYNNSPVPYAALPFRIFGTYNSNSFTFTLLTDVGLSSYFGNIPRHSYLAGLPYPGWGLSVPGLNTPIP